MNTMNMMIFVRNITYGVYGKNDHLFTVNKNDTLLSLKEKIISHFKTSSSSIEMFDDKTEQLLNNYDQLLCHCFSPSDKFPSITFGEE